MDREARMDLHRNWRVSLLVLLVLGVSGLSAVAQVPTGTIEGTVKDSQGLSIAGAAVTLTNEGTAKTQTDTTSSRGAFQFTYLNVGIFRIEVSKTGVKTSVFSGLTLCDSTVYSVPPV